MKMVCVPLLTALLLLITAQHLPAPVFEQSTPVPAPTAVLTPKPPTQGSPSQDSSAAAPRVPAYLTSAEAEVGQTVTLRFRVAGSKSAETPESISVEGLENHRTGSHMSFEMHDKTVNSSVTYDYAVVPLKPGTFKIPSQSIRAADSSLATPELTLHVVKASTSTTAIVDGSATKTSPAPFSNIRMQMGMTPPPLRRYRPRSVSVKPQAVYRGEIKFDSDNGPVTGGLLSIKLNADLASGTMTVKTKQGDLKVAFSGVWDSETFHGISSKNAQWGPGSFTVHFAPNARTATYESFNSGKQQIADLRLQ
jgi:hypothetical protein